MTPLTDDAIKAAPAGAILKCHVVPGLHVRVRGARRSFFLYYRADGTQRRPKLGDWPTLTLPRARARAKDMLAVVASGGDPSRDRADRRSAPRVADLMTRFLSAHSAGKKSERDDRRLARLYVARLDDRLVADLDYEHVADWHASIAAKVQANRALALLSTAMNYAERWRWRPLGSNPCQHVRRNPERKRRRYMTPDEAAAIAAALDARRDAHPQAVAFIYLLIYTGARLGEIARATWADIRNGVLHLPDSKSGHPRAIYLPGQALDMLRALPRTSGTLTGIKNPYKVWNAVRVAAGCPDLRLHDLRRSFASVAVSAGLSLHQIGELLGHRSAQTTKGYAYLMDDAAIDAAASTGDMIQRRLLGQDVGNRKG